MVQHIVMWNMKEEVSDREAAKKRIKENLENLIGVVPTLKEMKVYVSPIAGSTHELALVSVFEDLEGLKSYQIHPAHIRVAEEDIIPYVKDKVVLDVEE